MGQPVLGFDPVILDRTDLDGLSKTKPPDLLEQFFQLLHPIEVRFQRGDLVGLLVTQIKLGLQDEVRPDVDREGIGPSLLVIDPGFFELFLGGPMRAPATAPPAPRPGRQESGRVAVVVPEEPGRMRQS